MRTGAAMGTDRASAVDPTRGRVRHVLGLASVAAVIVGFTAGWTRGDLVLDGPGHLLWVEIVLDTLRDHGRLFTWWPQMWAGSPAFLLAPSPQVVGLVPLAAAVGAEWAVKLSALAAQVVGAWGVYVFAWSMWRRRWPAVVGGLAYGLHPIVLTHVGLFGHIPMGWVLAAIPWFAWSLRRMLEPGGRRHVLGVGVLGAFAVVSQGEAAYALVFLAAAYVLLAAMRDGARRARTIMARTTVAGALALGLAAFWVVPVLVVSDAFALNPDRLVRAELEQGAAATLARTPSAYLTRTSGWTSGELTFDAAVHFDAGTYYLGLGLVVLAAIGVAGLRRHDRDGTVSATMLAGAAGLWSSSVLPLASTLFDGMLGWAAGVVVVASAVVIVWMFVRHLGAGDRWAPIVAAAAVTVGVLVAPFSLLREVVPMLEHVRFPRLYAVTPFALVVGATSALAVVAGRLERRRAITGVAVGAVLVGLLVLDVAPYASVYRLRDPGADDYRRAASSEARTASREWWDPSETRGLGSSGLSTGWPHPIAGAEAWRLAAATWGAPHDYTLHALGLSATRQVIHESWHPSDGEVARVGRVFVTSNPYALDEVRAYRSVVVSDEPATATHLATLAAHRGIGVVTAATPASLDGLVRASSRDGVVTGDVGWVAVTQRALSAARARAGFVVHGERERLVVGDERSAGAVISAEADGLTGVAFDLDRDPGATILTLSEEGGVVVRESPTVERTPDGFWRFSFEPIADSAGRRFHAVLDCPACDRGPRLTAVPAFDGDGDLLRSGRLEPDARAAVVPVYAPMPELGPAEVRLERRVVRPGEVVVRVEAREPALVVSADAYFPGWQATVDGKPRPVVQADGAFLGVAVEPGLHEIRLRYRLPMAAVVGRAISVMTLVAAAVGVVVGRRRWISERWSGSPWSRRRRARARPIDASSGR